MRNDASPPFCEAVAEGRPGIIRPLTHSHQLFINSTNNWKKPTFSVKISCLILIAKTQKSGFFSFQTSSFSLEERAGMPWPEGRQEAWVESHQAAALVSDHQQVSYWIWSLHNTNQALRNTTEKRNLCSGTVRISDFPTKAVIFSSKGRKERCKIHERWCFFLKDQCCP